MLSVEGWFLKISDALKFKCFNELATVKFQPDLQIKTKKEPEFLNIAEELNNLSEWCISEFGSWGVPVPYFVNQSNGQVLMNEDITRHVASLVRQKGSDVWY